MYEKNIDNKEQKKICDTNHSSTNVSILTRTRTSWYDAHLALNQILKGKADGNQTALLIRDIFQSYFFNFGYFVQKNAGKVLFVGLLVLFSICVGLKSVNIETNVEKLWVEVDGRLEKELDYIKKTVGENYGNTNQLLIQTPKSIKSNILHKSALLYHLDALMKGLQVTVEMFEVTWGLKDVCYSLNAPAFEEYHIDETIDKLIPCAIITPLDCFWEGSKLLGPFDELTLPGLNIGVKWTSLNPSFLLKGMELHKDSIKNSKFTYEIVKEMMDRAGITTAYQNKPCLNISDPECPFSAPNKQSNNNLDIGVELSGGCYGFATKWMHWPEELIIGGVQKNKSGHIKKATALQSIVQLMGEQDMYDYWKSHWKVHNIDWSTEKAKLVLDAWQRQFLNEINVFTNNDRRSKDYSIHQFTSVSLSDIMKNFSYISPMKILIVYLLMLFYATFVLKNCDDSVDSHCFLGVTGVSLIALSISAGLGLCALIRLPFNASTTQIIPFLAIGIGIDALFLLTHTYVHNLKLDFKYENVVGETLKQIGSNILLATICSIAGFLASSIIPIPALRVFAFQSTILIIFTSSSILILFPALISIDLKRRKAQRYDLFCCFQKSEHSDQKIINTNNVNITNTNSNSNNNNNKRNIKSKNNILNKKTAIKSKEIKIEKIPLKNKYCYKNLKTKNLDNNLIKSSGDKSAKEDLDEALLHRYYLQRNNKIFNNDKYITQKKLCSNIENGNESDDDIGDFSESDNEQFSEINFNLNNNKIKYNKFSIEYFVNEIFVPVLKRKSMKIIIILISLIILLISLSGLPNVEDGLELTDIVPRNTSEYYFLSAQHDYFNVYNMLAITQGNFDYPNNQLLLYEYHKAFTRIERIVKNDDGGVKDFWLQIFRDWLINLQRSFDKDWINGCITEERWFQNASVNGILAYKLLVQTGRVDNPVDKSLVKKIRLVDENGIINRKAFYNYLTVWVTNDAISYSASAANFRPEPRNWIHVPSDYELKIPKSQPLIYTQIPFYLNKMKSTKEITETIQEIRHLCKKFEEKGLPNFPTGLPFIFWEQYVYLRLYLLASILVVLAAIFLIICFSLFNPLLSCLIIGVLLILVIELFGIIGLLGIRLSAAPAIILILSLGLASNILIHLSISFLSCIGNRNYRMGIALEHMFTPLMHGIISTFFSVAMLAFSEFDFIIRYFFYLLCGLIALGAFNGLFLFPVLLSLIGPPAELIPCEHPDRISTPSPPSSPILPRRSKNLTNPYSFRKTYPRVQSEISLSTISEEPQSYQSSHDQIVVQPELVVETTTVTSSSGHHYTQTSNSTSNLNKENINNESPTPSTDRDTPESGFSRDSPTSSSNESGGSNRCSSSNSTSSTTTCTYPHAQVATFYHQPQTFTTKVTTTAKLKVELHRPYLDREYSNYNANRTRYKDNNRRNGNNRL